MAAGRASGAKKPKPEEVPLWRKGLLALELLQPEQWERDALLWTSRKMRGVSGAASSFLYLVSLFWLALAALLIALYFPAARIVLLFTTAAIALVIGIFTWVWAMRVHRSMAHRAQKLESMAEMSNIERHAHVVRKVKQRRAKSEPPSSRT